MKSIDRWLRGGAWSRLYPINRFKLLRNILSAFVVLSNCWKM